MRQARSNQLKTMTKACWHGLLSLLFIPAFIIGATPVAAQQQTSAETEAAVQAATQSWATAWSSHDVEGYLGQYASDFEPPDNLSRAAWEKQRRQRLTGPSKISVQVEWVGVSMRDDGSAEARFIQRYRSSTYSDQVLKTLTMTREGGAWKIRRETSEAVTEQALAAAARAAQPEAAAEASPQVGAVPAPVVKPEPEKTATPVPAVTVAKPAMPEVPPPALEPSVPAVAPTTATEPEPATAVPQPSSALTPMPTDAEGKDLYAQIQRTLLSYDMNHVSKFLIDIYFSPFYAMSAYRQMLQWSAAYPPGDARRDDLVGMVREGMESVVRYSAVGIALPDWKGRGQPISVIYGRSLPRYAHFPEPSKPETLRWNTIDMVRQASPASIGESLSAKALMIMRDRSAAGQELAPVLLASALAELDILATRLFLNKELGPVGKGGYVPDVLGVDDKGSWSVLNAQSQLHSQAALLQGLVHVNELLAASNTAEFFASGSVQGKALADWRALSHKTLGAVYDALIEHHWDGTAKSFVGEYDPQKGRGNKIALEDAMVVADALHSATQSLPKDAALAISAREKLLGQAGFIKAGLEAAKGTVPAGFMVPKGTPFKALMPNLMQYVGAMSILLAADDVGGRHGAQESVAALYETTRQLFWSEQAGVYRIASGFSVSAYDGRMFGAILRWLQRMNATLPALGDFDTQADNLIRVVLKGASLIQSEGPANGEVLSLETVLETRLPAFVEELKAIDKSERRGRISDFVLRHADQDGDGIPGLRHADEHYGGAPVVIGQTSVSTPFETQEGGLPRL